MTLILIIITSIVSLLGFYQKDFTSKLIFSPYVIKEQGSWWRFITCGFLHADFFHLFINMFVLWSFGQALEYYYSFAFGAKSDLMFISMYVVSIFAANVSTYYTQLNNPGYHSLGASGAVSAVVFTTILFRPWEKIFLYGIIGLPGVLMGIAWLVYSWWMSKRASDQVNHEAHFYGAIFGVVFTLVFKPALFLFFIRQLLFMH